MTAPDNPFRAGMALPPPVLAGRDAYLDEFATLMTNARTNGDAITRIFIGLRGVGKTVLLNAWRNQATDRGWIAARLAADPDPANGILATLVASQDDLIDQLGRRRPRRTKELTATLGLDVGPLKASITRPAEVTPTTAEQAMRRLGHAAAGARTGVYLALDDLQAAPIDELSTIAKLIQTGTTERLPIVVAGAALPELRGRAPEETSITFTERVSWTSLGALGRADTERAMLEPFHRGGWTVEPGASDQLVELSEGYPYLIQMLGTCAWDLGHAHRRLTAALVKNASDQALDKLDNGMYRIRWSRCSPAERTYLAALAHLVRDTGNDQVTGSQVARLLQREAKQLSTIRQRLINKNLIEPAGSVRGAIRFTLPLYDRYILHHAERTAEREASRWRRSSSRHREHPDLDL